MSRTRLLVAAGISAAAIACSGNTQTGGNGGSECRPVEPGTSSARIDAAMTCFAAQPDGVEGCRTIIEAGENASPDAVRTAIDCVFTSDARSNGAWLASLLNSVSGDSAAVAAAISAMESRFDEDTHANSFATALAQSGQRAVGESLAGLSPELRTSMVSIGLGYSLQTLIPYCLPYIDLLPAGHPGFATLADNVDQTDGLDETERMALAASGIWSPQDVVRCYEGAVRGCESWSGASPLELLPLTGASMEPNPAPNNAIRLLNTEAVDTAEAAAIATWLAGTEYEFSDDVAQQLIRFAAQSEASSALRVAVAARASGPMCDGERLRTTSLALADSDVAAMPDSEGWPTIVRTCGPQQDETNLSQTLAAGWYLSVSELIHSGLTDRLTTLLEDTSCSDALSMAQGIRESSETSLTSGIVYVEVAESLGDRCWDDFSSAVTRAYTDTTAHPDTRLAAGVLLAEHGDRRACNNIQGLLNWREPETRAPAGARAEERAAELRAACGN
jgi:hypothetical protein